VKPLFELKNVTKRYGQGAARVEVFRDLSLNIFEGEFTSVVGFSGTGKTTLVSLLAGLLLPDEGEILYKGKPITGPHPERGLVFQNYSLLPWLSVGGNVALAVDQIHGKLSADRRQALIRRYVEMVNLLPAIDKLPRELSGGMRQRTAVARALSAEPDVLLLDEPLSALDALTRAVLQDEIVDIWRQCGKTVLLITNSVDEGIYMADRIIPLKLTSPSGFGPEFRIDIPRPRSRREMNHDETYKRIRNDVLKYLADQKKRQQAAAGAARAVA
jgi:nitrate/nitrite transport system ATP-binding protein